VMRLEQTGKREKGNAKGATNDDEGPSGGGAANEKRQGARDPAFTKAERYVKGGSLQ